MDDYFVFTDLHGCYEVWKQIEEFLNGRPAIFLGDAADRGLEGYQIMKELLDSKNITYLKGNHEDMFVKAAFASLHEDDNPEEAFATKNLFYCNGGQITWLDWQDDGCSFDIIKKLNKLPLSLSVEQYDFCHSGCLVQQWENNLAKELFWNRAHFTQKWFPGRILIHGHTPTASVTGFRDFNHKAICYNDKIDLDIGTIVCGQSAVYNLATNKVIYISADGIEKIEQPVIKENKYEM